jgi:putative CocE/NonD family hydrolase
MKAFVLVLSFCSLVSIAQTSNPYPFTTAQDSAFIRQQYDKAEYMVEMRDGVKLFTQVYSPRDASVKHPIIIQRTPYSCSPYGVENFKKQISPNPFMLREGYIVVYQDVRGRWASQGKFVEMTPHLDVKKTKTDIDESTDTFDTIDWLIKNIKNNNGKVGQWGISYPGFFASAGTLAQHPALKASSPQAPMADLRRDDSFHNGAFMLAANFGFYNFFQQHPQPLKKQGPPLFQAQSADEYNFYLNLGPLKMAEELYYKKRNLYFTETLDHPDYDEHWKARNILPHLKNIKHAVMIVGGWYDAEDLYGTFKTYQAIEKQNPGIENIFVVGPWVHGGWASASGESLGDVSFGQKTSPFYQQTIETEFFRHYLIDNQKPLSLPEATLFETGTNQWRKFDVYPPPNLQARQLYFHANGKLSFNAPAPDNSFSEFLSDPSRPVPVTAKIGSGAPRHYMVEDQRFAFQRPDVLSFQTDTLTETITLAGNLTAMLKVSTTGTDADWVVKVIDVYPDNTPSDPKKPGVVYGGFQQLIRSEIIRGKYRNNPEKPEPFTPGQVTNVAVELQDVLHTFKKGHRIMVQIQSSCFPWADRNPQTFTNIFSADRAAFQKAFHRLYHNAAAPSALTVGVLK